MPCAVSALPEGDAFACRAPASGSGEGPGAHARAAGLLARLSQAARGTRWRGFGTGGVALADRGIARIDVRAGIAHGRAGFAEADRQADRDAAGSAMSAVFLRWIPCHRTSMCCTG